MAEADSGSGADALVALVTRVGDDDAALLAVLRAVPTWGWRKTQLSAWQGVLARFRGVLEAFLEKEDRSMSPLVREVLRFESLLLRHSSTVRPFEDLDILVKLLDVEDEHVILASLDVLCQFYETFFYGQHIDEELMHRVEYLASGLLSRAHGFRLHEMCMDSNADDWSMLASEFHFMYQGTHAMPAQPSRASSEPITSPSKQPQHQQQQQPVGPTTINIKNFSSVRLPTKQLVAKLAAEHGLPANVLFALGTHIRVTRGLAALETRRCFVQIKVVAIKLAMSFQQKRRELLSYFLRSDPQLIESLIDLLKNGSAVPLANQSLTLKCLRKLSQSPFVTHKLRDLGVLQHGLVPGLVQHCVQHLGKDEHGGNAADFVRFSESLLGLVEQLVATSPMGLSRGAEQLVSYGDTMEQVLSLLKSDAVVYPLVVLRALRVVEKLFRSSPQTRVVGRFHELKGLETCLRRLQEYVACKPESLLDVSQSGDTIVVASSALRRGVISTTIHIMCSSIKQRRSPIRFQALKDGTFSSLICQLLDMSSEFALDRREDRKEEREGGGSSGGGGEANEEQQQQEEEDDEEKKQEKQKTSTTIDDLTKEATSLVCRDPRVALRDDKVYALTCQLLSLVIGNHPSFLKILHGEGVTRAFLETLRYDVFTYHTLKTIPETIRCVCLLPAGLELVKSEGAIKRLLRLFVSCSGRHISVVDDDLGLEFVGKALEETLRHFGALVPDAMDTLVGMLDDLCSPDFYRGIGDMYTRIVFNVAFLMELFSRHFTKEFLQKGSKTFFNLVRCMHSLERLVVSQEGLSSPQFLEASHSKSLQTAFVRFANREPAQCTSMLIEEATIVMDAVSQMIREDKPDGLFVFPGPATPLEDISKVSKRLIGHLMVLSHVEWFVSAFSGFAASNRKLFMKGMKAEHRLAGIIEHIAHVEAHVRWAVVSQRAAIEQGDANVDEEMKAKDQDGSAAAEAAADAAATPPQKKKQKTAAATREEEEKEKEEEESGKGDDDGDKAMEEDDMKDGEGKEDIRKLSAQELSPLFLNSTKSFLDLTARMIKRIATMTVAFPRSPSSVQAELIKSVTRYLNTLMEHLEKVLPPPDQDTNWESVLEFYDELVKLFKVIVAVTLPSSQHTGFSHVFDALVEHSTMRKWFGLFEFCCDVAHAAHAGGAREDDEKMDDDGQSVIVPVPSVWLPLRPAARFPSRASVRHLVDSPVFASVFQDVTALLNKVASCYTAQLAAVRNNKKRRSHGSRSRRRSSELDLAEKRVKESCAGAFARECMNVVRKKQDRWTSLQPNVIGRGLKLIGAMVPAVDPPSAVAPESEPVLEQLLLMGFQRSDTVRALAALSGKNPTVSAVIEWLADQGEDKRRPEEVEAERMEEDVSSSVYAKPFESLLLPIVRTVHSHSLTAYDSELAQEGYFKPRAGAMGSGLDEFVTQSGQTVAAVVDALASDGDTSTHVRLMKVAIEQLTNPNRDCTDSRVPDTLRPPYHATLYFVGMLLSRDEDTLKRLAVENGLLDVLFGVMDDFVRFDRSHLSILGRAQTDVALATALWMLNQLLATVPARVVQQQEQEEEQGEKKDDKPSGRPRLEWTASLTAEQRRVALTKVLHIIPVSSGLAVIPLLAQPLLLAISRLTRVRGNMTPDVQEALSHLLDMQVLSHDPDGLDDVYSSLPHALVRDCLRHMFEDKENLRVAMETELFSIIREFKTAQQRSHRRQQPRRPDDVPLDDLINVVGPVMLRDPDVFVEAFERVCTLKPYSMARGVFHVELRADYKRPKMSSLPQIDSRPLQLARMLLQRLTVPSSDDPSTSAGEERAVDVPVEEDPDPMQFWYANDEQKHRAPPSQPSAPQGADAAAAEAESAAGGGGVKRKGPDDSKGDGESSDSLEDLLKGEVRSMPVVSQLTIVKVLSELIKVYPCYVLPILSFDVTADAQKTGDAEMEEEEKKEKEEAAAGKVDRSVPYRTFVGLLVHKFIIEPLPDTKYASACGQLLLSICTNSPKEGAKCVIKELRDAIEWVIMRTGQLKLESDDTDRVTGLAVLQLCALVGILRIVYMVKTQRKRFCRLMVQCGIIPTLLNALEWIDNNSQNTLKLVRYTLLVIESILTVDTKTPLRPNKGTDGKATAEEDEEKEEEVSALARFLAAEDAELMANDITRNLTLIADDGGLLHVDNQSQQQQQGGDIMSFDDVVRQLDEFSDSSSDSEGDDDFYEAEMEGEDPEDVLGDEEQGAVSDVDGGSDSEELHHEGGEFAEDVPLNNGSNDGIGGDDDGAPHVDDVDGMHDDDDDEDEDGAIVEILFEEEEADNDDDDGGMSAGSNGGDGGDNPAAHAEAAADDGAQAEGGEGEPDGGEQEDGHGAGGDGHDGGDDEDDDDDDDFVEFGIDISGSFLEGGPQGERRGRANARLDIMPRHQFGPPMLDPHFHHHHGGDEEDEEEKEDEEGHHHEMHIHVMNAGGGNPFARNDSDDDDDDEDDDDDDGDGAVRARFASLHGPHSLLGPRGGPPHFGRIMDLIAGSLDGGPHGMRMDLPEFVSLFRRHPAEWKKNKSLSRIEVGSTLLKELSTNGPFPMMYLRIFDQLCSSFENALKSRKSGFLIPRWFEFGSHAYDKEARKKVGPHLAELILRTCMPQQQASASDEKKTTEQKQTQGEEEKKALMSSIARIDAQHLWREAEAQAQQNEGFEQSFADLGLPDFLSSWQPVSVLPRPPASSSSSSSAPEAQQQQQQQPPAPGSEHKQEETEDEQVDPPPPPSMPVREDEEEKKQPEPEQQQQQQPSPPQREQPSSTEPTGIDLSMLAMLPPELREEAIAAHMSMEAQRQPQSQQQQQPQAMDVEAQASEEKKSQSGGDTEEKKIVAPSDALAAVRELEQAQARAIAGGGERPDGMDQLSYMMALPPEMQREVIGNMSPEQIAEMPSETFAEIMRPPSQAHMHGGRRRVGGPGAIVMQAGRDGMPRFLHVPMNADGSLEFDAMDEDGDGEEPEEEEKKDGDDDAAAEAGGENNEPNEEKDKRLIARPPARVEDPYSRDRSGKALVPVNMLTTLVRPIYMEGFSNSDMAKTLWVLMQRLCHYRTSRKALMALLMTIVTPWAFSIAASRPSAKKRSRGGGGGGGGGGGPSATTSGSNSPAPHRRSSKKRKTDATPSRSHQQHLSLRNVQSQLPQRLMSSRHDIHVPLLMMRQNRNPRRMVSSSPLAVGMSSPALVRRSVSVPVANVESQTPPLVTSRILRLFRFLLNENPAVIIDVFFSADVMQTTTEFGLVPVRSPSTNAVVPWIVHVFALFSQDQFVCNSDYVSLLTGLIDSLLEKVEQQNKARERVRDFNQALERQRERRSQLNEEEEEEEEEKQEEEKEHKEEEEEGDLPEPMPELALTDIPIIPTEHLRRFVRTLESNACPEKTFDMSMSVVRRVAVVPENKSALVAEIAHAANKLVANLSAELRRRIAEAGMEAVASSEDDDEGDGVERKTSGVPTKRRKKMKNKRRRRKNDDEEEEEEEEEEGKEGLSMVIEPPSLSSPPSPSQSSSSQALDVVATPYGVLSPDMGGFVGGPDIPEMSLGPSALATSAGPSPAGSPTSTHHASGSVIAASSAAGSAPASASSSVSGHPRRRRRRGGEVAPHPPPPSAQQQQQAGAAASSDTWATASKQARLLRFVRFLSSLDIVSSPSPSSSSSSSSSSSLFARELEGLFGNLDALWSVMDEYLATLSPPANQGEGHNADHMRTKRPVQQQQSSSSSSAQQQRRQQQSTKGASKSMMDHETLAMMRMLPLVQAFFIVNVGGCREPSEAFLEFCSRHRRVLNLFCRKHPQLLDRKTGVFEPLLRHPKKILDFDNKHQFFRKELNQLRRRHFVPTKLVIRRSRIFDDAYHQFRRLPDEALLGRMAIRFYGEEGIDAGGLTREFFLVLSRAIFNPDYALFTRAADNHSVFQPNRLSYVNPDHLQLFEFVGRFVGKAILDGQLLDAYFTRSFYKHMLGVKPSYHDFESLDPDYYKSLVWMLENKIDDVLELTFSAGSNEFGRERIVDLKPNGRNLPVTDENKAEYIELMTQFRLSESIKQQTEAFLKGFHAIIRPEWIRFFHEQEMELLICGLPDIDIDELKAQTDYRGYKATDRTIQWFWQIVQDFDEEEKALFLLFVTGTSKVPIEGFANLQGMNGTQRFQIHRANGSDRLPTAHTCFNQLDLPEYSSMKVMQEKLLLAIREGSEGFGFR